MSTSIQQLGNGMQSPVKKQLPKEGAADFGKLITNLTDSKESENRQIKSETDKEGSAEQGQDAAAAQPEKVAAGIQGFLDASDLKQLLLKGKGGEKTGVHGFTKEELLELDPVNQKSELQQNPKSNKSPVALEGELHASEVKLKMMKMAEQSQTLLLKQNQSELLSFLKRTGIELPPGSMATSINQEQVVSSEITAQSTEEVSQVQLKTFTNEQLMQTTSKEEMTVIRARQFSDEFSQLMERMQVMKNGKESQLRIKLSPENLGQLDIRLTTIDGKVTAHIATSTSAAKEMIEAQLHQLRQTLVQQGIQLDKVEVVQQSSQSLLQDSHHQQGQQFEQGKYKQQNKSGQYEVEENPVVTHEHDEETDGINYSV